MEKTYAWELLLGFTTDTYDLLGMVPDDWKAPTMEQLKEEVEKRTAFLSSMRGDRVQPYPPYSSARFKGHKLFWWASQGRLSEVKPYPSMVVKILDTHVGCVRWVPAPFVLAEILQKVSSVSGESFRQAAICQRWRKVFSALPEHFSFPIVSVRSSVSSGTYIRSIAHDCGGVAWSICRISVAQWSLHEVYSLDPIPATLMRAALALVRTRIPDCPMYIPL